jgi:hypothetical protein
MLEVTPWRKGGRNADCTPISVDKKELVARLEGRSDLSVLDCTNKTKWHLFMNTITRHLRSSYAQKG